MKKYNYFLVSFIMILLSLSVSYGQDKVAKISLTFDKVDSLYVCKALVISDGKPVIEVPVNLSVKRLFGNLIIGDPISTDSTGVATFEVPQDIPSKNGKLTFYAKIEDDENYMNTETTAEANWGMIVVSDNSNIEDRSIAAGRDKAPIYFITASLLIIGLIWGTLIYAVMQVFKIRRLGNLEEFKE